MPFVVDADDPGNVEENAEGSEQHAEGDEDGDGPTASGDVHGLVEV